MAIIEKYEALAKQIAKAQKARKFEEAGILLQSGSEKLAKETGKGYFETKEMVVFCLKGV